MKLSSALKAFLQKNCNVDPSASDDDYVQAVVKCKDTLPVSKAQELATLIRECVAEDDAKAKSVKAADVFGAFRVKAAGEQYSNVKSVGRHSRTGQPVRDEKGREVQTASELELAQAGALLKHVAHKAGISSSALSEHEQALLNELADSEWNDSQKSFVGAKALIDDITSGGLEATPTVFDANLITFPLLSGELFPFVDLQEVPRGRRIEGAAVGNPSLQWGTAEGTDIDLFDTADLISAVDTNVFAVTVAIEIGLDFLSDSPANVGSILTNNIGQKLAAELDRIIALGDGVTQPQGVSVASGTITCNSVSGGAGPLKVSDFENLMFSVPKQYRNAAMRPMFISNDSTYARSRGIAVSPTDQRRVFGVDTEQSYTLLGNRYAINNDLPNNVIMFACLAKYRMYRRLGMTVKFETGGKELSRKNLGLLVVRARFGGRVVDSNAVSKMVDAQS